DIPRHDSQLVLRELLLRVLAIPAGVRAPDLFSVRALRREAPGSAFLSLTCWALRVPNPFRDFSHLLPPPLSGGRLDLERPVGERFRRVLLRPVGAEDADLLSVLSDRHEAPRFALGALAWDLPSSLPYLRHWPFPPLLDVHCPASPS